MNLNKVLLIGRLTGDPELRNTSSGRSVANFSIATNRYWNNDSGERQEDTQYHNIVVWGRQAEAVNQFLNKGSLVLIEGRLQTRKWEDNDGNNRRTTEVVAQRVQFGPKSEASGPAGAPKKGKPTGSQQTKQAETNEEEDIPEIEIDEDGEEIDPDDIPF